MVDRIWRAVSIFFSGRVNISFTHACTIKNSSSDIVFNRSLGHLSVPGALPRFRECSTHLAISWLVGAPRNLPCVPLAVLCASILSLVISSSAAIVTLICRKSVKCQHLWQKASSSRLLCSAVSCGILAQVLLALPQSVIVGSGRRPRARTQPSGETHLTQPRPRWRRARGRGRNLSRCERRYIAQLLKSTFLIRCRRLVPLRFVIVLSCELNLSAGPWAITPENLPTGLCSRKTDCVMLSCDFCSCKCNHAPLARLCSDELWEGARGGIVSVLMFAACPAAASTKSVARRCSLKKSVQIHASSWRGRRCGLAQASFDHPCWCRPHPVCLWVALETWPRSSSIKELYFRYLFTWVSILVRNSLIALLKALFPRILFRFEISALQPVPWKIKLEMVKEMQIEILNGGEILVN